MNETLCCGLLGLAFDQNCFQCSSGDKEPKMTSFTTNLSVLVYSMYNIYIKPNSKMERFFQYVISRCDSCSFFFSSSIIVICSLFWLHCFELVMLTVCYFTTNSVVLMFNSVKSLSLDQQNKIKIRQTVWKFHEMNLLKYLKPKPFYIWNLKWWNDPFCDHTITQITSNRCVRRESQHDCCLMFFLFPRLGEQQTPISM